MTTRLDFLPAIDLMEACAVRLFQGKRDQKTIYSAAPWEIAAAWREGGADRIHLVDLDAAFDGSSQNALAIRRIVSEAKCPTELGGGIRDLDSATRALEDWGVDRIIVGTVAAKNPAVVEAMLARFGNERVIVGIDARDGEVKVSGWVDGAKLQATDLGRGMHALGIKTCVYTDISRDGTLTGPNLPQTATFARETGLGTVVSGGISGLSDLEAIAATAHPGIVGVIVGKALFENRCTAPEAAAVLHGSAA